MSGRANTERILDAFLAPEADRLPDRVLDAALDQIARSPQRHALRVPWRFTLMPAFTRATSVAAVALVAVVGAGSVLYLTSNRPSTAAGPTVPAASATPAAPTPSPSPSQAPAATRGTATQGRLNPGTYDYQATWAADPALTVTFTLTEPWELFGNSLLPGREGGGIAIQFLDVTGLQRDPCHWSGTDDDVDAGTTVADLVAALEAQKAYDVSDPVDVTIGGFGGQRVDIVGPTEPFASTNSAEAPDCDEGVVRLWTTREHGEIGIYLQGPANRWQANILDVDGTRLVVLAQDFPTTTAADRARLDAVLESIVIQP